MVRERRTLQSPPTLLVCIAVGSCPRSAAGPSVHGWTRMPRAWRQPPGRWAARTPPIWVTAMGPTTSRGLRLQLAHTSGCGNEIGVASGSWLPMLCRRRNAGAGLFSTSNDTATPEQLRVVASGYAFWPTRVARTSALADTYWQVL